MIEFFTKASQSITDGPTDRRTDGRTDTCSYRDARTHLKKGCLRTHRCPLRSCFTIIINPEHYRSHSITLTLAPNVTPFLHSHDLIRSHPIRSHPIRSHPIRSHPIRSHPIRSHPIRSHLIRSHPIRSHPIRSHPI